MRAAKKIIHSDALQHNIQTLKSLAPQSQCVAVVKANAYGCGATALLSVLDDADMLATASYEEALVLRQAGSQKPILLLEGAHEYTDVSHAFVHGFELVITTQQQLQWLLDCEYAFSRVWFKIDTGMGRLGFTDDADAAMQDLLRHYTQSQIVLMTHFSDADSPDRGKTLQQIERFDAFASRYPYCQQSLCNSAGTLAYPDAHRDFIRPGIAVYGVSPFVGNCGEDHGLQAVMTLSTRVMSVKDYRKGEPIGYGESFHMPKDGRIAVCEIGYADGYLRCIPSGTGVLINGCRYTLVGRVSMDMITVLVDDGVSVGDHVICWGQELPVECIAEAADTIAYQLLTTVTQRPQQVMT